MLFLASDLIRSGVFVVAVIGMSNGIVLPTVPTAAAAANHLDDLIRDVFNDTSTTTDASSNVRVLLCAVARDTSGCGKYAAGNW